jgi:uncharacterized protein (TIGR02246 family)
MHAVGLAAGHEGGLMGQERGVEDFFAATADAWKTNDGSLVGSLFVEDGTLINPFGQRADGLSAIAAMYAEYFGGMLSGTTTSFKVVSVRAVGTDHAFVDAEQTICAPTGEVVLAAHLVALLRRRGDSWLFVDSRPYSFAELPA